MSDRATAFVLRLWFSGEHGRADVVRALLDHEDALSRVAALCALFAQQGHAGEITALCRLLEAHNEARRAYQAQFRKLSEARRC